MSTKRTPPRIRTVYLVVSDNGLFWDSTARFKRSEAKAVVDRDQTPGNRLYVQPFKVPELKTAKKKVSPFRKRKP